MRLCTGIDFHSSNSYLAIIDETGKRVFKKKLPNDPEQILSALRCSLWLPGIGQGFVRELDAQDAVGRVGNLPRRPSLVS